MKKYVLMAVSIATILLLVASCKKGDIGPQGSQGPQGPQGPIGTANVMYSAWFTPTTYIKDTIFSSWGFSHTQPVPAITQSILDNGTVLTFAKLLGYNQLVWPTNQVGQLPVIITYMQGGVQNDTWQARSFVGNLKIRFVNENNIYTSIATQHQFRYIIIPGGIASGRLRQLSYEEICRQYNIPE
jgi:hypothetical protein